MIPEDGTEDQIKASLLESVTCASCHQCRWPVVTEYPNLKVLLCANCLSRTVFGAYLDPRLYEKANVVTWHLDLPSPKTARQKK